MTNSATQSPRPPTGAPPGVPAGPTPDPEIAAPRSPMEAGRGIQWRQWPGDSAHKHPELALRGLESQTGRLAGCAVVVLGLGSMPMMVPTPSRSADARKAKAFVMGEEAHAINPGINVIVGLGFAQDAPLSMLRQADAIVMAGDNLDLVQWAGRTAKALSKPLLQGAVHGESWSSFIRGYPGADPSSVCPVCGFSARDSERLRSRHGCDPSLLRAQGLESTRTAPNVCAMAGELLVGETLKILLGADAPSPLGIELAYCALSHRTMRTSLQRNLKCRRSHASYELLDVARAPSEITMGEFLRLTGAEKFGRDCLIRGEVPWAHFGMCAGCLSLQPVGRFVRAGAQAATCKCGGSVFADSQCVQHTLLLEDARDAAGSSLAELGVAAGGALRIWSGDHWCCYFLGGPCQLSGADPS